MSNPLWRKLSECLFDSYSTKSKNIVNRCRSSIIVGGINYNNLFSLTSVNYNDGTSFVRHPQRSSLNPSFLLSYSVYESHSVLITNEGSMKGIGGNTDGRISNALTKTQMNHFTDFSIRDKNGRQLFPISAVCTAYGTLYMLSKEENGSNNEKQLVYCDCQIKGGSPIFLDIDNNNNKYPVALFGGSSLVAAINNEGEVIFINRNAVINSPESKISPSSLPNGEKASSVACCSDSILVLSTKGRVFLSQIDKKSNVLNLSSVKELADEEIVYVSGTYNYFFAVNKEGRVFGKGSNENGKLELGEGTESVSLFTEISSLSGYKISEAYAGAFHSLFVTKNGQVLACGSNTHGQLLLNGKMNEIVYSPTEKTINGGATFCIVGTASSIVFIGGKPPQNMPNKIIKQSK